MKTEVPVLGKCDVLVAGGTLAGCRQAEALRAGRKCTVTLAAPLNFLGEDCLGTGALHDARLERLFPEGAPTPAGMKAALEDRMFDAGVKLLYEALPIKPVHDINRHVAGWLFLGRGGYFIIAAAVVIDATADGILAAQARGAHKTGGVCTHLLRLRLLGGCRVPDAPADHALAGLELVDTGTPAGTIPLCAYERRFSCRLGDDAALAREEARLRCDAWSCDTVAQGRLCELEIPGQTPDPEGDDAVLRCAGEDDDLCDAVMARLNGAIRQLDPVSIPDRRLQHDGEVEVVWKQCFRSERHRALKRLPYELSCIPEGGQCDVIVVGGGTAGAAAAIAAARQGARVLLIERLAELGGIMTAGRIGEYFYGNRCGFCAEMAQGMAQLGDAPEYDPAGGRSCREWKSHWLLKSALEAGVEVRFSHVMAGVALDGRRVVGVAVASPRGNCQLIRSKVVIDATGDAAVAAAAGALVSPVLPEEPVAQGAGLCPFRPGDNCTNSDFQFICDSDPVDATRAFVMAHDKFRREFDVAAIAGTRERRHVIGELQIQPQDIVMRRRYHDVVAVCSSSFDTHGMTVHPLFMMAPPASAHVLFRAQVPLRALLPQKLDALLVVGLGISAHRDAMPVLRMQPDAMNIGYSAGLAAAMAAASGCALRALPMARLQEQIIDAGILRREEIPDADDAEGADDPGSAFARIAALLLRPDQARRRLQAQFEQHPTLELAKLLAFLGDSSGRDFLQHAIAQAHWDEGWNYRGMGQFGASVSPVDSLFFALRAIGGSPLAAFTKLKELPPDAALSHIRAVAMYFIRWPSSTAAIEWLRLLNAPGIAGHALGSVEAAAGHNRPEVNDTSVRNSQLKELYISAALFCCQPLSRDARGVLEAYRDSPQALYAEFAAQVLARRHW